MARFWTKDKIEKRRKYFEQERIEKRGKFTEFVVRTYYCIYKACSLNDGISCYAKDVSAYKIKNIIYEDVYNGIPDHGFKMVIDDCVNNLKFMQYIKFSKVDDKWMIYLNKPLDFLQDGEHELYLEKYNINGEVYFLENMLSDAIEYL